MAHDTTLTTEQVNALADRLNGTADSLDAALDELQLRVEPADLVALDQIVFLCDECSWWCEASDMAEGDEWICGDCAQDRVDS